MGGLIFAALFPFAPLGAAAAVAYSLAHPPLSWMTGVGRWEVHTIFSALGAVWTAACVAAAQRWRARIVRRGLAPGRDAP